MTWRALLACLALAACQPRTEIVLGFATDLHATGELDHVTLHVSRVSDGFPEGGDGQNWDITGVVDQPVNLPASFGLYSDDEDVQLDVRVSATRANTMIVDQRAVLSLVSGQTLFYRMGLTASCEGMTCGASMTCVEGTCLDTRVDPSALAVFRSELVDHLSCNSGTTYIETDTGQPMELTSDASACPMDRCSQGTCYRAPTGSGGGGGGGFSGQTQTYVKASNTDAGDDFGYTIAVSADGTTLAVGAFNESSAATGIGGNQADNTAMKSGAVYVYAKSGTAWVQQAYIKASNAQSNTFFGYAVALSSDGNRLAVGSFAEASASTGVNGSQANGGVSNGGAAYTFTRSSGTWTQEAYFKATNTRANSYFGNALALSGDGKALAVAAYQETSNAMGVNGNQADTSAPMAGAVYTYSLVGTTWMPAAYVKPSNTRTGWLFGTSLALSSDGTTLAVGAPGEASSSTGIDGNQTTFGAGLSGAVYVYTCGGTSCTQQAYIKASNAEAADGFGTSLSLSGDGNKLAVTAYLEDSAGKGVGAAESDNAGTNSGAAYVFTRSGSTWSQQAYVKASNTDGGDEFGQGIALSADGSTLAVGSLEASAATGINDNQNDNSQPSAGAVYVFASSGSTWAQTAYVKSTNTRLQQDFGYALSLSGNGSKLVVGAWSEASNATGIGGNQSDASAAAAGAAYVYE